MGILQHLWVDGLAQSRVLVGGEQVCTGTDGGAGDEDARHQVYVGAYGVEGWWRLRLQ